MVRRGCRAAHDAVHVRMRLSSKPDHRMMWGRGTRVGRLKWLLGKLVWAACWDDFQGKPFNNNARLMWLIGEAISGLSFYQSKTKMRFSEYILNIKEFDFYYYSIAEYTAVMSFPLQRKNIWMHRNIKVWGFFGKNWMMKYSGENHYLTLQSFSRRFSAKELKVCAFNKVRKARNVKVHSCQTNN